MGKRMIYLVVGVLGFALGLMTSRGYLASAEELRLVQGTGSRVMTVEQLLQSYEWYSDDCAKVRSDLYLAELEEDNAYANNSAAKAGAGELQVLSMQLAEQKGQLERTKAEYEAQYRELAGKMGEEPSEDDAKQAEEALREIGILEEQIAAYETQDVTVKTKISAQELAVLDADLAWKGKAFYTDYGGQIEECRTDKLKYEMLSEALLLSLLEKQQEYYECQEEWLSLKKKASKVRVRFGIADVSETEAILREQTKVDGLITETKRAENRVLEELKEEAQLGDASLVLSYETVGKSYRKEVLVSRFCYGTESYMQLGYYGRMYREYGNELPEGEDSLKVQAAALASNYELQEQILREQLECYAEDKLAEYEELQRKLDTVKGELGTCEKRYKAECRKFDYGMATKLSVAECKAELLNAELEYLQCLVNKVKLEYVLDHGVVAEN